jgi:uncharacterized protein (DUF302 family)
LEDRSDSSNKELKLFEVIDHGGEAEKAGLYLRPTKLLIFGSPKAGTPLMVASPTSAIDLPLKILVWVDDEGRTQVSYNSAAFLAARHSLPPGVAQNIAGAESLLAMGGGIGHNATQRNVDKRFGK